MILFQAYLTRFESFLIVKQFSFFLLCLTIRCDIRLVVIFPIASMVLTFIAAGSH